MGGSRLNVRPSQFECGICSITYKALNPGCPLCEATRELRTMREALTMAKNMADAATTTANRAQRDADLMHCIKEAGTMLNDDDRSFLKVVLYQWRDKKSVGALKVTRSKDPTDETKMSANGFLVVPRDGEPYAHTCSSIGGMAIASHFDEAVRALGQSDAMSMLSRGLATMLPGGAAA